MTAFSHLATFAFGAVMGMLLTIMVVADGFNQISDDLKEISRAMRDDIVMLPASKPTKEKQ